jgi:hypothetical protein
MHRHKTICYMLLRDIAGLHEYSQFVHSGGLKMHFYNNMILIVMRRLFSVTAVIAATAISSAWAASTTLSVTIDTDNNTTTGCTVTTSAGTLSGIEIVLDTVVNTSGASTGVVGSVTKRICSAGVFGSPIVVSNGGWPVGMGAGNGGNDVIETFILIADLAPSSAVIRVAAITSGDLIFGGLVRLADEPTIATVIPTNSTLGLALMTCFVLGLAIWRFRTAIRTGGMQLGWMLLIGTTVMGSTVAWVYAITRDGITADWIGIAPLATDPSGDAAAGQDLVALYAVRDVPNLSIRIDAILARDVTPPINTPPVISGLNNQTLTLPIVTLNLTPTVTDDGLPAPPGALTYAWTQVSGSGLTFSSPNSKNTTVTFGATAGVYTLRLTVSDSALSTSRDITVNVNAVGAINQPPVVSAGPDQAVRLDSNGTLLMSLAGSVSDDGLPAPINLTSAWSVVSGPGLPIPVSIGSPSQPTSQVSFAAPGSYVLRLTASDGVLSSSDDVIFTVNAATNSQPTLISPGNQTMALGSTLKLTLATNDSNVRDTLTYSLPVAPASAQMNPGGSAHLRFAPTTAGVFNFTARVADQNGLNDQKSFTVTVVSANRAPQLVQPANVTIAAGAAFSRTLVATDPDGDTLNYQLISSPSGMTLSGASVFWTPTLTQLGQHTVKVSVRDPSGAFDAKMFTLTVTSNVAPSAKNDTYSVKVGGVLNINAAEGVLANDIDADGNALSAIKLTNPDKGSLSAFNPDGSFTYAAPATLAAPPALNPVVSWRGILGGSTVRQFAADFDGDGKADFVSSDFGNFRAWRGSDGSQLWQFDSSLTNHVDLTGCTFFAFNGEYALGDVTGNGKIDLFMSGRCTADNDYTNRYMSIDASTILAGGKVAARWLSQRLSVPHPGAYATPTSTTLTDPPSTYPFVSVTGGAYQTIPTLAKLTPAGATKLLFHSTILSTVGGYYDMPNSGHIANAGCRLATGIPSDEGRACKITYILDAATGAIEHKLVAPNTNEDYRIDYGPTYNHPPIIADLDGDGQVEIISGGEVWKLVSGNWVLAWQATFLNNAGDLVANEPDSVAVADLDGDGKAEIVMHVMPTSNSGVQQTGGIYIYSHDGTLKRKIRFDFGFGNSGLISVADVDGDGTPEILLSASGNLYVYRSDGALKWAKAIPDILSDVTPVIAPDSPGLLTGDSPVYVYDLNLDGKPEIILQATRRLFILDGATGDVLWSLDTESSRYNNSGNPLLVDADGDGHIDILVNLSSRWNCSVLTGGPVDCKGGTFKISGGDLNWAPGPKVQNQMNFRASAINDQAVIRYDGSVRRDYRQQIQQGTIVDPRIAQSTRFTYKANDGAADSLPATVTIDIKPPNRPPVITSIPPTAFFETGPAGVQTVYTITAIDPDPGDTVRYEFVAAHGNLYFSAQPTVDPTTGKVDVLICGAPCGDRPILIVIAAIDSFGARTEQSMMIYFTPNATSVPNVVGQFLITAQAQLESAILTPRVIDEQFNPAPIGTVLGQSPAAGAPSIPRTATVGLTVSKGPAPVLVPNVISLSEATALSRLSNVGFTVTISRAYSQTIPRGEVVAQIPAAGTTVTPTSAALTVSSGSGLEQRIAQGAVVAGGSLGFTVLAFNADGSSAVPPPVTLSVTPRGAAIGTTPTVSGNSILTNANALGGFDLIATEIGGAGRVARTTFAVLLAPTGIRSPQKPIADLLQVVAQMEQLRQTLDTARALNDNASMRATLAVMATTWKNWSHRTLAQTPLLITPTKLPMLRSQLESAGRLPTPEDLLDREALEALTQAMRDVIAVYDSNSAIPINTLRSALLNAATAAKPLAITTPSVYGAMNNLNHTTYLATRAIPQSLSLLMREIERTLVALPGPIAPGTDEQSKAFSGSLAELSATTSIHMDLMKDYYGPIIWKVVSSGAALAGQGLLRDLGLTGETALSGIVTGASQSFHIFEAPGTFIEQVGASDLPEETQVWILGPSAISAAIEQIRGLIKGFSAFKDLNGLNSRLAASSAAEAQALLRGNFTDITGGFKDFSEQLYAATNILGEWPGIAAKGQGFFLAGNQVERGCIFDGNPFCKQIFFGSGFPVAEKCDPRSFCVPLALLVITWTPSTMAFGAEAVPFIPKYEIPCAKDPLLGISLPGVPPGCTSD